MAVFVLIHGAWHGGWCWEKIGALLQQKGHTVHAPDLPGHGKDCTPIREVTLPAYVERVLSVIAKAGEPVVLAGHSMGGIVISQVAEERPQAIRSLVYICAFLPQDGQTLLHWAEPDREGLVMPNLVFSDDKASATIKPEVLREAFYADCGPEEVERAKSLLVPQAAAPFMTAVRVTTENSGRVPRFYVECLQDRAITISTQRQMHRAAGCRQVFTLDSGHSPFFSMPEKLTECLLAAAEYSAAV